MTAWTSEELSKIEAADELEIESLRSDGRLRRPTTIWVSASATTSTSDP